MTSTANDSNRSTGYVRLYRSVLDDETHPLVEKRAFTKYEAKIDLLLSVRGTDSWREIDGKPFQVKRGSEVRSVRYLAKRWQWSQDKVHRFLRFLELRGFLRRTCLKNNTLIEIVNYNEYNPLAVSTEHEPSEKRARTERQPNENKKCNTGNECNVSAQAREFITWFGQEFQTVTGSPYMATFGKENKLAEQMIKLFGLDEVKRRAVLFLRDEDKFIRNSTRDIGMLKSQANRYADNHNKTKESQFDEFDPTDDQY